MKAAVGELCDKLNEMLKLVERAFVEIATTRVSVSLDERHDLAFGKLANEWCLILESYEPPAPTVCRTLTRQSPLRNVPIELRLLAVDKLEALHARLLVMSDEQARQIDAAALRVAEFVGKLARDAMDRAEAAK